jgi:uncharacterized repeat protein (TIGR01451 family)
MQRFIHRLAHAVHRPAAVTVLALGAAVAACSDQPTQPTHLTPRVPPKPAFGFATGPYKLSESSYDFGTVMVGTTTPSRAFTITNVGTEIVGLAVFTLEGANFDQFDFDFSYEPSCWRYEQLGPGASCVVGVRFAPTREQPASAWLDFSSNGSRIDARVELSGVGSAAAPIAAISPQEVFFAEQPLGTQGTQSFQVRNVGGKDLVITKLELTGLNPGDFALANGSNGACQLDAPIAPGSACDVTVAFKPAALGSRAATVGIATNAGATAAHLYGTGTGAADLSVAMNTLVQGKSITYTVTAKNAGPTTAEYVLLTDVIPAGTTFASIVAPTNLGCMTPPVGGTGEVKCGSLSFASGETATVKITVKVAATKMTVSNTATIASSATVDLVTKNNTATVTTVIGRK